MTTVKVEKHLQRGCKCFYLYLMMEKNENKINDVPAVAEQMYSRKIRLDRQIDKLSFTYNLRDVFTNLKRANIEHNMH